MGVRVLKSDAEKLPPVRTDLEILHKSYAPLPPQERLEYTDLTFSRDTATLSIGDSKEGWAQALTHYFDIITNREYRGIRRLVVDLRLHPAQGRAAQDLRRHSQRLRRP